MSAHWTKIECPGRVPEPRSHHSSTVFQKKIIIFGGFRNSNQRYNDIWIFDTELEEWSQPPAGVTETTAEGEVQFKRPWADVPQPRGSHSATLFGSSIYIFGGYGGAGFARRDFNDLNAFDLATFTWKPIESSSELPEPRSGHQSVAVQNKLYVMGGWNSMEQFNSIHIFDLQTKIWSKHSTVIDFGPPRWSFCAVSVNAVPFTKIFVFGGNSGDLSDGGNNPQGTYLNDLAVLDTGTNQWSRPTIVGTPPLARAETE